MNRDGSWQRYGECNNCGWCCQVLVPKAEIPLTVRLGHNRLAESDQLYFEARGIKVLTVKNGVYNILAIGDLVVPCPHHVDNSCNIQKTKPKYCRDYPTHPFDIVSSPCSYWFESGEQKIGGEGSPYPFSRARGE